LTDITHVLYAQHTEITIDFSILKELHIVAESVSSWKEAHKVYYEENALATKLEQLVTNNT
jgi:hypothetical protein